MWKQPKQTAYDPTKGLPLQFFISVYHQAHHRWVEIMGFVEIIIFNKHQKSVGLTELTRAVAASSGCLLMSWPSAQCCCSPDMKCWGTPAGPEDGPAQHVAFTSTTERSCFTWIIRTQLTILWCSNLVVLLVGLCYLSFKSFVRQLILKQKKITKEYFIFLLCSFVHTLNVLNSLHV